MCHSECNCEKCVGLFADRIRRIYSNHTNPNTEIEKLIESKEKKFINLVIDEISSREKQKTQLTVAACISALFMLIIFVLWITR